MCLDKITVRDPDRKLKLAARSKEQLDGSANVSGTTSPIPDTGEVDVVMCMSYCHVTASCHHITTLLCHDDIPPV